MEGFKKINEYLWEIPQKPPMRVPARFYASEKILNAIEPGALKQVINVSMLPGIIKYSLAMPDIHIGYSFVIGGVAAMDIETGVISPSGVGFDINCGMRVLKSKLNNQEIQPYLEKLAEEIQTQVPSGLGIGTGTKLKIEEIDQILENGAQYIVKKGYGEEQDLFNCESHGRMPEANSDYVSERAKQRGRDQVGTLGSGNHFIEIQKVEQIFNQETAETFGLFQDQVIIMIHTGSRGLGHQIATDYIRVMMKAMLKYNIKLPDRELAACPINSPEGKRYFSAMACAANFAWANRQMITSFVRKVWEAIIKEKPLALLYDVAHNIAKIEEYVLDNRRKVVVHRKGATRAFPPNHPEIPEHYQKSGQPVLIPGSMGTASYILAGTEKSMETWHTVCHGAGRTMSRKAAIRTISGEEVIKDLKNKGIIIKCRSLRGIAEEAPLAYKNIDQVVEVINKAGLAEKIARLVPLAVIKGE